MTGALVALESAGQAPWLDYLHRELLDGELERLIAQNGVRGLTSNPAIFEAAIAGGAAYDSALAALIDEADGEPVALYERLAIADIQRAADQFRPLWESLGGADGYVSLEVSPYLAHDAEATVVEARRLWRAVDRPNLMVKVPGTAAGAMAIARLIAEGVNVNVTLLFGLHAYAAAAEAYMSGLEALKAKGGDLARVHGVASFFISRIDVAMDRQIDARILSSPSAEDAAKLRLLRGRLAVDNAKLAYQAYLGMTASPRWRALASQGATPQRLLWASTSVKDPARSDVSYVEALIGPDTINTLPLATLEAFADHGRVAPTLTEDLAGARERLTEASRLGLDLAAVTRDLAEDGVARFAESFDGLLGAIADKRRRILGPRLNRQHIAPGVLDSDLKAALDRAAREDWIRRLWARDASLWPGGEPGAWLGWLDAAFGARIDRARLKGFAADVASARFSHALLLGMGGSSLGPEVIARVLGAAPGYPELLSLDSTDPDQIARIEAMIDPAKTLFIVSSKSGSTLEADALRRYFMAKLEAVLGHAAVGGRFVAITDPGSPLERIAQDLAFWRLFSGAPDIGGRYSVMSHFGMVPAATLGLDMEAIFEALAPMARACGASAPPRANPGVALGVLLGVAAMAGRDKVSLIVSESLADLGDWLEQLIAESLGKQGKGLIPITGETLAPPERHGQDRLFIEIKLADEDDSPTQRALAALEAAGRPVVRIALASRAMIFQEFFRWQIAVAVAGAVLAVNPFDQPDVEASKTRTRAITTAFAETAGLAPRPPVVAAEPLSLYADPAYAASLLTGGAAPSLDALLTAHLARLGPGDYFALLAYLDRAGHHMSALARIRRRIGDGRGVATTVGFGPRFLHSTGQIHKGGPNNGVFLQLTASGPPHLPVPGMAVDFGAIERAQAQGDFEVLAERGRRVLWIDLGPDAAAGLSALGLAINRAVERVAADAA